jgi:hypothetical protein
MFDKPLLEPRIFTPHPDETIGTVYSIPMAVLGTDNRKSEHQSTPTVYKHILSVTQQLTARSQQLTPDKLTANTTDRYTPTTKSDNRPPTVHNRQEENSAKNRLEATSPFCFRQRD